MQDDRSYREDREDRDEPIVDPKVERRNKMKRNKRYQKSRNQNDRFSKAKQRAQRTQRRGSSSRPSIEDDE